MKMVFRGLVLLLAMWSGFAAAGDTLTIGILAARSKEETTAKWQPLVEHLNKAAPEHTFKLQALYLQELREAIRRGQVDLVITQPAEFVRLSHESSLSSPLATLVNAENGKPVKVLGGAIVTRSSNSKIESLNDLQGRSIATPSTESFGAYQAQAFALQQAGITPGKVEEHGPGQDATVMAMLRGETDAAFVRSGVVEAMVKEGKMSLSQVRFINQQTLPGYPLAVSTALYPEWPLIAMPHIRDGVAERVAGALLSLPHGGALAKRMGIYGFTIPANYEPVRDVMRELQLPPFDRPVRLTPAAIWQQYRLQISLFMIAAVAIIWLAVWSTFLSRKLWQANQSLEEKVRLRTQELSSRNDELAQTLETLSSTRDELVQSAKMAALGSLVAGVAHELNTPLGNGLTMASTLDERAKAFAKELDQGIKRSTLARFVEDARLAADVILRNLAKANDLVSSFKQIAVDQSSAMRRVFPLAQILTDIKVMISPSLDSAACSLQISGDCTDIELDSFPGPLEQAISNLVHNSIRHAYSDGAGGPIRITYTREGTDAIRLEISDDGVGIPPDNLPRVFEPFFTTRFGQGGSGLGLHIVHNMVAGTLGGKVSVKSTLGQGTTFAIVIPRVAPTLERS